MSVRANEGYVFVKPLKREKEGLIEIPDDMQQGVGTAVSFGQRRNEAGAVIPCNFLTGDLVRFFPSQVLAKIEIDGEKVMVLKHEHIYGWSNP